MVSDIFRRQLTSNAWASKPVFDPLTMRLLFRLFLCPDHGQYSPQDSAPVFLFFSRQSKNPSYHPAAHSTQQYQFHHARKILLGSSLANSPASVLALSTSVSNFYPPKFLWAPRHPCLTAHSEFLLRNRCVISIANDESSELCTQTCI